MPSWEHSSKEDLAATMGGALLPSTYLLEGEDPADTLDRIVRKLVGVKRYDLAKDRPLVYSATQESGWYPGHAHWDVAFVYDVKIDALPERIPPWWRALEWRGPDELRSREFAWNDDLVRALRIARR